MAEGRTQKILTNHIPPVELSDGSFFIALEHTLKLESAGRPGRRTHLTLVEGNESGKQDYEDIAKIEVTVEFARHSKTIKEEFDEDSEMSLQIWLEELPFRDPSPSQEPDVIVKGNFQGRGRPKMSIETRGPLGPKQDLNVPPVPLERNHKYPHTPAGLTRPFRIREWRIVDPDGEVQVEHRAPASGADEDVKGYKIQLRFYGDEHHE